MFCWSGACGHLVLVVLLLVVHYVDVLFGVERRATYEGLNRASSQIQNPFGLVPGLTI